MADEKKAVLLYCDIITTVEKLSNEDAGLLFKHYLRYINDKSPEPPSVLIDIVFEPIKQNLKRDLKKWNETIDGKSESGILGNLKRWNNDLYIKVLSKHITIEEAKNIAKHRTATKGVAKIAVKDTVIVNVTDTVNDNVTVNDISLKEKKLKIEESRGGVVMYNPEQFLAETLTSLWIEETAIYLKLSPEAAANKLKEFAAEQKLTNGYGRALGEIKKHFFNTVKKTSNNGSKKNTGSFQPGGAGKF